jgi:hypothetical protein
MRSWMIFRPAVTATASHVLVLAAQSHNERDGSSWVLTTSAFGLLAAWPYAISYLIASHANTRTLVSTFVQTILLCLVTALVCSTYTGHLFHPTLTVWNIVQITATQAFLFFAACGLGEKWPRNRWRSPVYPHRALGGALFGVI